MAKRDKVNQLMERHGHTFCDELGVNIADGTPSVLFRWLTAAILFSARIHHDLAIRGAKALSRAGYRTAQKMAEATWEDRVRVLNENGYARYDERTASMLQDAADLLVEKYDGDLRKLRATAERDVARERKLLKEVKGLGDVGVSIFFREVQLVWEEHYPFADKVALRAAERHDLGKDASTLARLVPREDYPRLLAALVRDELQH